MTEPVDNTQAIKALEAVMRAADSGYECNPWLDPRRLFGRAINALYVEGKPKAEEPKKEPECTIVYKIVTLCDGVYGSLCIVPQASHYRTYEVRKMTKRAFIYPAFPTDAEFWTGLPYPPTAALPRFVLECRATNIRHARLSWNLDDSNFIEAAWADPLNTNRELFVADVIPTGRVFERGGSLLEHDPVFNPKPDESDEAPAARLDPEYMSKHPELWEVGDEVKDENNGLIERLYDDGLGQRRALVRFMDDGTTPAVRWITRTRRVVGTLRWISRPPLPKGTLVSYGQGGDVYYVKQIGTSTRCYLYHSWAALLDDNDLRRTDRSKLTALMLPPEGGWG